MPIEFTRDSAAKVDVTPGRNRFVNLRSTWRNLSGSDCLGSIMDSAAKADVTIGRNRLIDFDPRFCLRCHGVRRGAAIAYSHSRTGRSVLTTLREDVLKGCVSSDDLYFEFHSVTYGLMIGLYFPYLF